MLRMCLLMLLLVFPMAAQSGPVVIEAQEKAWRTAVLKSDTAALDAMYSADLIYSHASGVVDTKSSFIGKIREGKQKYASMEPFHMLVRLHGDMAISHAWVRVTGVNPAGPFDDKVIMMHVWQKQANQWLMVAHQTSKVTDIPSKRP